MVLGLDGFAALLVLGGVEFGFLGHLLDLFFGETGGALDGDFLIFAGAEIFGGDVEDAVGVDVEGDFDLGRAAGRGRDAVEFEGAEGFVVLGHGAFALEDDDFNARLIVAVGGERLGLLRRDRGVARDHGRRDVAGGHDAEGQRGDVEEEHVTDVAFEDAALDGRADGNDFIGVDALVRRFAAEGFGDIDDLGHAGHAADEHEFVDLVGGEAGVFETVFERLQAAFEKFFADLLHLGAAELHVEVLRAGGVGGDERQVDVDGLRRGERDFGFLGFFLEALERHRVFAEIDAVFFFEGFHEPTDEGFVPVVAAEVGVAIGGFDFENAVADLEHGDVKGTAAQIEHGNFFVLLFIQAVGQRGGGGLVDDAEHVETGDLAGVFGSLALGVVEIRGDGDDGLRDFLAEIGFGIGLEFTEDERRDLLGRELLGLFGGKHFDVSIAVFAGDDLVGHVLRLFAHFRELAADETFRGENGVAGIGDGLALGGLADQTFAGLRKRDDGRRGARAFGVGDHDGLAALHDRHARVGGAKIDA